MTKRKPKLLLTSGDPNGIGPEIILKIFNDKNFSAGYDLYAAGSAKVFQYYSNLLSLKNIPLSKLIEVPSNKLRINPGKISPGAGKFSGDVIKFSVEQCLKEKFDALITLPVSKEALNLGGYSYPGHTEMLTKLTSSKDTVLIMNSQDFSVALITGHIALSQVSKNIRPDALIRKLTTVNNTLVKFFRIKNPKMALLSLNPHAGDGGVIGDEENKFIIPVIEKLNSIGFNLRGPYASDAYFANKSYKKFDITIAMYHDQGLIPFKMISFGKGVNFTAGLKILRTSPDHGTAFDIAGLGRANPLSTMEAIRFVNSLIR